jgi:hypothetical protein
MAHNTVGMRLLTWHIGGMTLSAKSSSNILRAAEPFGIASQE